MVSLHSILYHLYHNKLCSCVVQMFLCSGGFTLTVIVNKCHYELLTEKGWMKVNLRQTRVGRLPAFFFLLGAIHV